MAFYLLKIMKLIVVVDVQSLSHVQLFVTQWTAACQASMSFTIFRSLPKLMSIKLVMPSNYLVLSHPLLLLPLIFPSLRVFSPVSWPFTSGGQRIGAPASASVLPMNIKGWFPLALTGLISLPTKGLPEVFNTTAQRNQFFGTQHFFFFFTVQHSYPYMTTGKTIALTIWIFVGKVMSLLFNTLSRITFLSRSKHLLISWLQSPSTVILVPK